MSSVRTKNVRELQTQKFNHPTFKMNLEYAAPDR